MNKIDELSVKSIRFLAAEAVEKAKSGHPGLAIDAAPMAYTLWKQMKHNPKDPEGQGRDRFVLSAGHASVLEYSLLHLFGYGLTIEDLKNFRQWGSLTPGHQEYRHTKDVAFGKSERFYAANRFGRILPRRIAAQKKVGNAHFGGKLPQRADVRLGGRARHGGIEIQILVKI